MLASIIKLVYMIILLKTYYFLKIIQDIPKDGTGFHYILCTMLQSSFFSGTAKIESLPQKRGRNSCSKCTFEGERYSKSEFAFQRKMKRRKSYRSKENISGCLPIQWIMWNFRGKAKCSMYSENPLIKVRFYQQYLWNSAIKNPI